MTLRVVEDRKVALQVRRAQRRLCGKSVVGAEARDKSIPTNPPHTEAWVANRQCHDRRVYLTQDEFFQKLNRVAMGRPNRATRNNFLVHFARQTKQFWIDKGCTAKFQSADLTAFDRNQRGNGFIARIQKSLGNRLESNTRFGQLNTAILASPK